MAHKTEYRFYIGTDFASDGEIFDEDIENEFDDIETAYDCDYIRFTNLIPNGDVKNIYQEDYAEMSGVRVYIPPKGSIAHKAYECKLKLLFLGDKALANAIRFQNDMLGVKVRWFDTFRNVIATLMMSKSMNIESERLYGSQKFVVSEYTFTNIDGCVRDRKQGFAVYYSNSLFDRGMMYLNKGDCPLPIRQVDFLINIPETNYTKLVVGSTDISQRLVLTYKTTRSALDIESFEWVPGYTIILSKNSVVDLSNLPFDLPYEKAYCIKVYIENINQLAYTTDEIIKIQRKLFKLE